MIFFYFFFTSNLLFNSIKLRDYELLSIQSTNLGGIVFYIKIYAKIKQHALKSCVLPLYTQKFKIFFMQAKIAHISQVSQCLEAVHPARAQWHNNTHWRCIPQNVFFNKRHLWTWIIFFQREILSWSGSSTKKLTWYHFERFWLVRLV